MGDAERTTGRNLSTGIPGLDEVLNGGLPADRLYLVEGEPGTGKTTLALQFLLEGAARGERGMYVTLAESATELRAAAASHGWSLDPLLLYEMSAAEADLDPAEGYTIAHPAEIELNETTKRIFREVERAEPSRIVFDSLAEMQLIAADPLRYRRHILFLKHFFAGKAVTVLLLDDRVGSGNPLQVQSIANGVIRLESLPSEFGCDRRRVRIVKLRGRTYEEGYHDFAIRRGGLVVFPRGHRRVSATPARRDLLSSGVAELDALTGGGLNRGSSVLLIGPSGTGKSVVATRYAVSAAERGEPVALYLFDESTVSVSMRTAGLGMDLASHVASGRVRLDEIDVTTASAGEFVNRVCRDVDERETRVVVIDTLNGYLHAIGSQAVVMVQLHDLLAELNRRGVLTLLLVAQQGILGATMAAPIDVSYLADTVILLRFFEAYGGVRRAISVVKKRGGPHEATIRELSFGPAGIQLGEVLRDFHGVLTGVPSFSGARSSLSEDAAP